MTKVSVDESLIKEAIDAANERDELQVKLATAQEELSVVYGVIGLAEQGYIDTDDILSKIAEFVGNPDDLAVFQKAVELKSDYGSLGTVTGSTPDAMSKNAGYGESAEATLYNNLLDLFQ